MTNAHQPKPFLHLFKNIRTEALQHPHATTRMLGTAGGIGGAVHVMDQMHVISPEVAWCLYGLAATASAATYHMHQKKEERNELSREAYPRNWKANLYQSVSQYAVTGLTFVSGLAGTAAALGAHASNHVMSNLHLNANHEKLGALVGLAVPTILMASKFLSNSFGTDNADEARKAKAVIDLRAQSKPA